MGNREIEKKFVLNQGYGLRPDIPTMFAALDICAEEVRKIAKIKKYSHGVDADYYWRVSKNATLRLREKSSDDLGELTIKLNDKGTNINRREENLAVESAEKALTILRLVHGTEEGLVNKFFTKFKFQGGEVAIYKVLHQDTIYLEVEASNERTVNRIASRLQKRLSLTPETRSMYELYVRKNAK